MPITACLRTAMTSGALAILLATSPSFANDPPKSQGGWASSVKAAPGTTAAAFDEKQMAIVSKVNGYFNSLTTLKGSFQQTDPDKKTSRGKFLLKKPGQFRFEYARPSRKVIISDGRFLAIQDHDLKTSDTYELDNTPFRVLLKNDVDLMRDAKVLEVVDLPDSVVVTLQDKSPGYTRRNPPHNGECRCRPRAQGMDYLRRPRVGDSRCSQRSHQRRSDQQRAVQARELHQLPVARQLIRIGLVLTACLNSG